jgi:hypothetical protein
MRNALLIHRVPSDRSGSGAAFEDVLDRSQRGSDVHLRSGGGAVANFLGGNTVSSLFSLRLAVSGNGPAPKYPGAVALNGPALGLPVNDVLRLAGRQTVP